MAAIDSLRCFLEAAQLLSFRRAARRVALSPAALGQRIKQLEEELGAPLFERTTRSVQLTEAGLRLLPYARRAVEAVDACGRAVHGDALPVGRELTLGTRHELGLSWILPLVPKLEASHPGLTLHLYFGSGADLLGRIRAGEIDAAVTSSRLTDPRLDAIKLHEERYVLVGNTALLRRHPVRTPADLAAHCLLDASAELPLFGYWRDAPGGVDSMHFQRVISYGTIAAIRHRVLRGAGLAVLPKYYVEKDLRQGRLRLALPRVKANVDHFRLVFRRDEPRHSLFVGMAEVMKAMPLR